MNHPPLMHPPHHAHELRPYPAQHARAEARVLRVRVDGVEELAAGHVLEHERVVRRERERGV